MDSEPADLYRVLGLPPGASRADIVRAYRQQARAMHPDARPADPDAPARFRALTEAYEVLSDPGRRGAYDRLRAHAVPAPPAPASPASTAAPASPADPASPTAPAAPAATASPAAPEPGITWLVPRAWPAPAASAPLWAGPVQVQPPPGAPGPAGRDRRRDAAEARAALLAYLLRRYLADREWPL